MKRFDGKAIARLLVGSLLLWAIVAAACVLVGSTGTIGEPTRDQAMLRLATHVLPASLIGAALAAAGVVFQAILRNPLADPYLLGTSSGAMLASYLWRFPTIGAIAVFSAIGPHAFALGGALLATTAVLAIAHGRGRIEPVTAILAGVIINSLCGAAFMLLNAIFRDLPGSGGVMSFLVGDIQTSASRAQMIVAEILIGGGWIALLFITPSLNAIRLSEDEAASLGVRVQRTRWIGLLLASLVTAAAVAISGPIGFIGLICPHIGRWIVGNDNRRLFILATVLGAALLALADAVARLLLGMNSIGTLIPVGVITSLIGGPFFLVLLMKERR